MTTATTQPGPLQSDLMMWSMLRTRRQRKPMPRGLDAIANQWLGRARHARISLGYLRKEADAVVAREKEYEQMHGETLAEQLLELRGTFRRGRQTRQHVRQALAAVRETAYRTTGERPYPQQLMGALGLFHGQIVEMVTGEGKTLTASVAATLLAWSGRPVHVVTVNDYLAERDAEGRRVLFEKCGLRVGALTGEMPEDQRAVVYQQPIVYATAREIMADWLRDQLKLGRLADPVSTRWLHSPVWRAGQVQAQRSPTLVPGLFAAIVDEIDAILIDEAVTPLIIAQQLSENPQADLYRRARNIAVELEPRTHFTIDPSDRKVKLTPTGRRAVGHLVDDSDLADAHPIWHATRMRQELVEQALTAEHCYHHGQHYQLMEEKVVIVDEYTGRFMSDRQWQHGLHQAVEAKENIEITADQQTLASISFQRFYRQYTHLCGMTGTAAEAKPELERTYGEPVRIIPTHRPVQRKRWPNRLFARSIDKLQAIVQQIEQLHAEGRPVLIGTRSVDLSEQLSETLTQLDLDHEVLNAVRHEQEADIISGAGRRGAITVATNMAGRGTDIKLGPGVAKLGGLHVILTELHTAKRVDRQFIGRSGRQGDPGSAQCFASLDDELLVRYLPRTARALRRRYAKRRGELPGYLVNFFRLAQARATRMALRARLAMIRHDHQLDQSLPG